MPITAKLDELGKPAWIALIVLGFIAFWPLGLAILIFTIWSGRMGCGYHGYGHWEHKMERMQAKMDRLRERMTQGGGFWGNVPSSGNRAFDEYRSLKRSSASSASFLIACASPRTRLSSTSS